MIGHVKKTSLTVGLMATTLTALLAFAGTPAAGAAEVQTVTVASAGVQPLGGCVVGAICGLAINDSDRTLKYSTDIHANPKKGEGLCRIWNGDADNKANSVLWGCTQQDLAPGKSKGGNFSGVDVDAVTFANDDYWTNWDGGTTWTKHIKGEWTRFESTDTVRCYLDGVLRCSVDD